MSFAGVVVFLLVGLVPFFGRSAPGVLAMQDAGPSRKVGLRMQTSLLVCSLLDDLPKRDRRANTGGSRLSHSCELSEWSGPLKAHRASVLSACLFLRVCVCCVALCIPLGVLLRSSRVTFSFLRHFRPCLFKNVNL